MNFEYNNKKYEVVIEKKNNKNSNNSHINNFNMYNN